MLIVLLTILHITSCIFLILVVLLQQGRGGGLGGALGGGATQQVFGGRGAGNLLTRLTAIFAATFMIASAILAKKASEGDTKLEVKPKSSVTTTETTNLPLPPAPAPSAAPADTAPVAPETAPPKP